LHDSIVRLLIKSGACRWPPRPGVSRYVKPIHLSFLYFIALY
jgi:hypothetical protein